MVDPHQLLHHFGGGGDLRAADRAIDWLRQAVVNLLRRIGLGDRPGPQFIGQIAIGPAPRPRVSHPSRHRVEAIAVAHGTRLACGGFFGQPRLFPRRTGRSFFGNLLRLYS